MRRRRAMAWALTLAGVGLSATPARGWDVGLDKDADWKSMYCSHVAGVDVQLETDAKGLPIENTGSLHSGDKQVHGNEHAAIADHVLWMIDPKLGQMFGTAACIDPADADANCPRMVDLNASWLRRGLIHPQSSAQLDPNDAGDLPDTTLEERRFPPLAMWATLPDFSYTIYDWINERRLCPALPANADHFELCHEYSAWLGAALNSTHFGHLPMKVYARYHQIALSLAARASALHKQLTGDAATWHRDYVMELERLALAYEAAGQHFVEDRWSTGHMIARWGPGSYYALPHVDGQPPKLGDAVMTGLLTGILHGSQAAFGNPDPLSAPLLDREGPASLAKLLLKGEMPYNHGTLARWRYVVDNKFSPPTQSQDGIGDYLFRSLMVGAYSGVYDEQGVQTVKVDPPISLAGAVNQRKGLVYCSAQGFRQVIAALGDNDPTLTSYGMLGLPLPEPDQAELQYEWVPGAERLGKNPADDDLCKRSWVTNDAWYMGLRTIAGQTNLAEDVAVGLWVAITGPSAKYTPPVQRIGSSYLLARAEGLKRVLIDQESNKRPDGSVAYGTDLAETSPTFYANGFWWKGNQNYDVPEYYEPADLDTLPERDEATGRDKDSIYGLFNKASVEYWCEQSLSADSTGATTGRLAELRDQIVSTLDDDATRDVLVATCSYLAERVEKRTDPSYAGPRTEVMGEFLPFDKTQKYGDSYEPVCKFLDKSGLVVTTNAKDDTRPYFLHPGYVATPGKKGARGHAAESLENWCKKIPVLDDAVASPDHDIVYTIDVTSSRWAMLEGANLGKKTPSGQTGQVLAQNASGQWQALDVWDEATKSTSGGWSDDGKLLYARIPPSGLGFPTAATPQMTVQELLALPPLHVPVRLVRAFDKTANVVDLLSDGAGTVGTYFIDVQPQVLQVQWAPVAAGTQEIRAEFCYAKWLRPHIQVLAKGVYKLQNGAYVPLGVPFTWYEDIPWQPTAGITCDPADERGGASISNPDPTVFDGSAVYVFAYH